MKEEGGITAKAKDHTAQTKSFKLTELYKQKKVREADWNESI